MKVIGNGTIEQLEKGKPKGKCRKWRLWVTTDQGRKSKRFAGTYTDAQKALKSFVEGLSDMVSSADVFGDYAESWRSWRSSMGTVSANMQMKDLRNIRALARTEIWKMRMCEVSPDDCRAALERMRVHPAQGKTLSPATMAAFHSCMSSIFSQACADGIIKRNPMSGIPMPKVPKSDKRALSLDEMADFMGRLDSLTCDGHVMAVYLMVTLGLRRGEALGLYVSDIQDGLVYLRRSVKEATGKTGEPKSEAGNRIIPMPEYLQTKIDEWLDLRGRLGLADAETLCCNIHGGVMRPQNMYKWWVAHRDRLGVPGLTMHELRHSYLTLMARHVSPFDLQRLAGWSSLAPAKIYVHDDLEALKKGVSEAFPLHVRTKNAP